MLWNDLWDFEELEAEELETFSKIPARYRDVVAQQEQQFERFTHLAEDW